MATQPRWKVKPTGFATVKVDGWWQKPGEPSAPIPGTTSAGPRAPRGGRTSTTTRTASRNALVPREWVGSEGLIGNWAREPRLDPTRFETIKSSETGRWWARPITELTGLTPGQRAEVRDFDATTKAQGSRIDQAFADFVAQSGQTAQDGSKALNDLTGLMGTGYSGDPTGAVLSEAARKEAGAGVAPIIGDLSRLPALARSEGLTQRQAWDTERAGQRKDLLAGIRETEAKLQGENADRAAELRGQELAHLGRMAGIQSNLDMANLRAQTADADRSARVAMNDADNATSRANTEARVRAAEKAAAKKTGKKPPSAETIRSWAKRARDMWDGVPRRITGDDGKTRTEYLQYDPSEILRELMAMGATRQRAVKIVRNITGQMNFGNPTAEFRSATRFW